MKVTLKVPVDEARKRIEMIPHKSCVKAINENWKVDEYGNVRAQSVFWLFCWAKTGMNSEQAKETSVSVFDALLPVSFAEMDAFTEHSYARTARYVHAVGHASQEVEEELKRIFEEIETKRTAIKQPHSHPHKLTTY